MKPSRCTVGTPTPRPSRRTRGLRPGVAIAAAAALALGVAPTRARAAGLNDYGCRPSAAHPYPVVLAHGQGGHAEDLSAIIGALSGAGYCVFGEDYGIVPPSARTGMDHLTVSGEQFRGVVQKVLAATGAVKVDAIGYSEGGGVIDNFILQKGGAAQVHRVVFFAGLHHPYGHVGLANVIDGTLFLPNIVYAVQHALPPFTSNIKFETVVAAFLGIDTQLSPADRELISSGFVADLFDGAYWEALHGGLSETPGVFATAGAGVRSLRTADAAPAVCYTNIVSMGDMLVGTAAGFQDEAPNVENFVLPSAADHVQIVGDPQAIEKMLAGLAAPCPPVGAEAGFASQTNPSVAAGSEPGGTAQGTSVPGETDPVAMPSLIDGDPSAGHVVGSGCAAAPGRASSPGWLLAALLALVIRRRRACG